MAGFIRNAFRKHLLTPINAGHDLAKERKVSDRELLELAAKAAGYKVRWHEVWKCFVHDGPHNIDNPPTAAGQRQVWTPLTDDGDALRLAVKLGLCVTVREQDTRPPVPI